MAEAKKPGEEDKEEASLELNTFLEEMVSMIDKRFKEQQNILEEINKRLTTLESREPLIDKRFGGCENEFNDINKKLDSLKGWIEESRKISKDVLKGLKG